MTYISRGQAEVALQGVIDAVNTLFVTREIRPGEFMHMTTADGVHETEIARTLLPMNHPIRSGRSRTAWPDANRY